MDISVFSNTLYGQVSGKSSEVAIELSILVSCQFFASYAIDIHANKFQPTNKGAFYLYHKVKTYLSSLFLEEQTYFQFPSSPVHQRRNQKS